MAGGYLKAPCLVRGWDGLALSRDPLNIRF
jgi:hypothetical protein